MTFLLGGPGESSVVPSKREYLFSGGLQVMVLQFSVSVPGAMDALAIRALTPQTLTMPIRVAVFGTLTLVALFVAMLVLLATGRDAREPGVRRLGVITATVAVVLTGALLALTGGEGIGAATYDPLFIATAALGLLSLPAGVVAAVGSAVLVWTRDSDPFIIVLLLGAQVALSRLTMWLLAVVRELLASRGTVAALSRDDERRRFSRDLHDVVGRDLSAIALKAELATSPGAAEQPRQLVDDIRATARRCLVELRDLVGGGTDLDLDTELDDGVAILQVSGVFVEVEGSAGDLHEDFRATASWCVREAVTNVLRHSPDATLCDIVLEPRRLTIRNDGAATTEAPMTGTGLQSMRERAEQVGAAVHVEQRDGTFEVVVDFSAPPRPERRAGAVRSPSAPFSQISDRQLQLGSWCVSVVLTVGLGSLLLPALARGSAPAETGVLMAGLAAAAVAIWFRFSGNRRARLVSSLVAVLVNLSLAVLTVLVLGTDGGGAQMVLLGLLGAAVMSAGRVSWTSGLVVLAAAAVMLLFFGPRIPVQVWVPMLVSILVVTQLALWVGRVCLDLEQARRELAALILAQERHRFGQELHQVVGRRLSQISLKSDLILRGADDLVSQAPQIRELAHNTLQDMRRLVTGYRTPRPAGSANR